jgi:hypothetical protein
MNPYPYKPKIAFKEDGSFKLTVLSDLHFGENPWDEWGPEQDRKSLILLRKVLKDERPDYVCVSLSRAPEAIICLNLSYYQCD